MARPSRREWCAGRKAENCCPLRVEFTFNRFVREAPPGTARPDLGGRDRRRGPHKPLPACSFKPIADTASFLRSLHTSGVPPRRMNATVAWGQCSPTWRSALARRPLTSRMPAPPAGWLDGAGRATWSSPWLAGEVFARGLHSAPGRDSLAADAATLTMGLGPVRLNRPPMSWLSERSWPFRRTYEEDNNGSRAARRAGLDGGAID